MSLISAAVCVGVMFVMSTLETRAVWAMAGRGKLRHGINFRFVAELRLQQAFSALQWFSLCGGLVYLGRGYFTVTLHRTVKRVE